MRSWQRTVRSVFILAVVTILVACGNPNVTRTNYHLLDIGMHYGEVVQILDEPDWCDDIHRPSECRWGDEDQSIEVTFVARRVVDLRATGLGQTR